MKFDAKAIAKLAKLAKIELTDAENEQMQKEVSAIVSFVAKLETLDTANVEPTSQVTGLTNVMRPDEITSNFAKEDMTATMPGVSDAGELRVQAVFTDHKDAKKK
jgi:aspartyl-tRNA(Asn)/glutamyl-tRNA(Gln) amidotransferase subunit C